MEEKFSLQTEWQKVSTKAHETLESLANDLASYDELVDILEAGQGSLVERREVLTLYKDLKQYIELYGRLNE